MKRLCSVVLLLIAFRCVLTVHWCYVCDGSSCHDSPLSNIRQDCRKVHNNKHQRYLCESRHNKDQNTTVKRCIVNNPTTITECDELNLHRETSCFYCDRELCNTGAKTIEGYLTELKSFRERTEN
ncbi:hypothetical protein Zmor_023369 [Zophobas morio]|uniref:Protein sleepless n=1 Tax=Zophobas morio TaxID=2755281 RepID=A0AA38HWS1_9CUCU|nr:hypothetical protein Zmor_023369 [Zophobas morio]